MFHGLGDAGLELSEFEECLALMSETFEVVSLAELVARLQEPARRTGWELALTFDDGLRSQVTLAYRVLERMAVPAVFFICPELIDTARWQWTHEFRSRL